MYVCCHLNLPKYLEGFGFKTTLEACQSHPCLSRSSNTAYVHVEIRGSNTRTLGKLITYSSHSSLGNVSRTSFKWTPAPSVKWIPRILTWCVCVCVCCARMCMCVCMHVCACVCVYVCCACVHVKKRKTTYPRIFRFSHSKSPGFMAPSPLSLMGL